MLSMSWLKTLQSLTMKQNSRVAVLGIGNEYHGDDAAGLALIRCLQEHVSAHDDVLLIEAGTAPENITGTLRGFMPAVVLLIDAVQMAMPPGTIAYLDWRSTAGYSASTHTLPLKLFCEYITSELGCEVLLLGIQVENLAESTLLSTPMEEAVCWLARLLCKCLALKNCPETAVHRAIGCS